jgi:cytochrome b561
MTAQHNDRALLESQRFGTTAIALHWFIAVAMLLSLALAWYLEDLDGQDKVAWLSIHKSVGIVIFVAAVARLIWRMRHPAPPYGFTMPRWQHLAAHATHILLYVLLFSLPLTGYVAETARGRDTSFFNLIPIPALVPLNRKLSYYALTIHDWSQYGLYALILLHVGAALYHQTILRDRLMNRMWPGTPARETP